MTHVLLAAVFVYRNFLSNMVLHSCRFWPSCSAYAQDALRKRGALRGTTLAMKRILRCHPFSAGGLDPVA